MKFVKGRVALAGAAVAVMLGAAITEAAMVEPGEIKIMDGMISQSLTGKAGDPAAGREVYLNRRQGNCLACHANEDMAEQPFHGEVGPPLDGVGDRYSAGELRAIVVNAKTVFGGHTIMPAFYAVMDSDAKRVAEKFQGKTILEAQQVEDIVAYLKTLK